MLVTFKTEAYANITMFGEVAVALLKLMGHSGSVPGALLPEDIPGALNRLKAAVVAHPQDTLDPDTETDDGYDGEQPRVSLAHRALPLIELLAAAAAAKTHVLWESP